MKLHGVRNQRGTVIVFTIIVLVFLLVMGGLAIDLAYHGASKGELQRSMDAAALAGAGKLGFDDTVFPEARQFAHDFAAMNSYRTGTGVGTIDLDLNPTNDPGGDIVLGIWQGVEDPLLCIPDPDVSSCSATACFIPDTDGTVVNAVCTQYETQIAPSSLLGILGFNTLPVRAHAIATSNPLLNPPDSTCIFPIGLSDCAFEAEGAFASNSLGCGAAVSMTSSSGAGPSNEPAASNTAAWVSLYSCPEGEDCTPGADETRQNIMDAANGSCNADAAELTAGTQVGANNGMAQSAFDVLEEQFVIQYNNGETYTVTQPLPPADGGGEIVTYDGLGWEVFVPIIDTDQCPPQEINETLEIVNWTKMVITQVINHGTCAVDNPNDTNSLYLCDPNDPGYEEPVSNMRGVFGYYSCETFDAPPNPAPVPRGALSTKLRLVR